MTVDISVLGGAGWQFFDNNGVPLAGGKLYTYAAGTTTPAVTYTSNTGATPHANPIILDSAGRVSSEIWLTTSATYKFVLTTSNDIQLWTKDNIGGVPSEIYSDLAALTGAGLVGFSSSLSYANNTVGQWLVWLSQNNDIRWYGYVGDGYSHPLSSVTEFKGLDVTGYTLIQWQTLVPQVTALTNQIDAVSVQAWFNDRPEGGELNLPAGVGVFDIGIQTGENQNINLWGAGRDLTEIKYTGTGTFWSHGFTNSVAATGTFYVQNLRITPAAGAAAACCFNVRFSGTQPAWCHVIDNVMILARDTTSYFVNSTITRNIQRGLDWRNFVVYGRNFFVLTSNAHVFPSNSASDPDCPPGQAGTGAGDSYNFDNCMTVGYKFGWDFLWTGFTALVHSHEQGRWANSQAYSGVGFAQLLDTNSAYAPADNWIFDTCGWQGSGPAFDLQYLEFVRIRDGLFVVDATSTSNLTRIGQLIDCVDTIIDGNEIFAEGAWTGGNAFGIGGPVSTDIRITENMTVNYASFSEWLFVASTVLDSGIIERQNTFRGTGTYTTARVVDASGYAISETRVGDIVEALPGTNWSWTIGSDGTTMYRNVVVQTTDGSGNITIALPTNLFRAIKSALATSGNSAITVPANVGVVTTSILPIRYPGVASTQVTTTIEVAGR